MTLTIAEARAALFPDEPSYDSEREGLPERIEDALEAASDVESSLLRVLGFPPTCQRHPRPNSAKTVSPRLVVTHPTCTRSPFTWSPPRGCGSTGLTEGGISTSTTTCRPSVTRTLTSSTLVAACGGSDVSGSDDGAGSGLDPLGAGILTVAGVDYDFEVFTCDLDGYENEGVEYDFDVAGIGSKEGRTYHVFARRSYHPEDNFWIEVIDLDYQDDDEGLHTLHGFSAAESEPFIFILSSAGVEAEDPVAFVSDFVDETPAGQGTIVINCP